MLNFSIESKVAVITGGGGVLGGSIATSLVKAGSNVAIIDIRQKQIENQLIKLSPIGIVEGYCCNVTDKDELIETRKKILAKWGRIDILINAAGGNLPGATLTEEQTIFDMQFSDFNNVTNLNINGTVFPSIIFAQTMSQQKSGCIINISSMATFSAITRVPGYSIAKNGINIFTQWMATEMALKFSDKIRVNAIAPGFFIGDQNRNILINSDGSLTERSKKVIEKTPMKRFGNIDELNGIVQFLCSDAASFITGVVIPVDGGFSSYSGV